MLPIAVVVALALSAFLVSTPGRAATLPPLPSPNVTSSFVDTTYRIASSGRSGSITSLQSADIMLSGVDFNNTGGALLFNHPGGIASDGQHLVVADQFNNRILVWNSIPSSGSVPPDFALGQKSLTANAPGKGLNGLDWPAAVWIGGGKLVVADSYNNRILIWSTFPTKMDQPADLQLADQGSSVKLGNINFPWGVWTDGTKLIVSSTFAKDVLIWNTFPTRANQTADLYLTAQGRFGTPRAITSDGTHLMVGDHSAFEVHPTPGSHDATFVWNTFPTQNDQPYDYYVRPGGSGSLWGNAAAGFRGVILPSGETLLLGDAGPIIFNSFPLTNSTAPALSTSPPPGISYDFYTASGLTVAGAKLLFTVQNNNYVVVYDAVPTSSGATPDFVIGSPGLSTNTLLTHYFFDSPQPATDGKSLFVASCLALPTQGNLYAYSRIPDQSGAYPNIVYSFPNTMHIPCAAYAFNGKVALGIGTNLYIWSNSSNMFKGQQPDIQFSNTIGSITLQAIEGVAIDSKYFYLSDATANKIYVWNGIPSSSNLNPAITLSIAPPGILSSDGNNLVVVSAPQVPNVVSVSPTWSVAVYALSSLSPASQPQYVNQIPSVDLLHQAAIYQGQLFVPELTDARVQAWTSVLNATSGLPADVQLGCAPVGSTCAEAIGPSSFMDSEYAGVGGGYLWIGEHDFSNRLLRFSFGTVAQSSPRTESYYIQAGSQSFTASLKTSTATSTMKFSSSAKSITMNLTATSSSYVNATFPTKLLNGSITVTSDGAPLTPQISHNGTHTAVYAPVSSGSHTLKIVGTVAVTEVTTTTTTAGTSTTTGQTGGFAAVTIQPSSGPSGTVVTISGTGLSPSHAYRYCYQSGGPPPPPNQPAPCPAGSATFTTGTDGSVPASPPVTLQITGSAGQYTVVVGDPSGSFETFAIFMVTTSTIISSSTATSTATTAPTTTSTSANTTSTSTAPTTSSTTTATSSTTIALTQSSTSNSASAVSSNAGGGGIPAFPYQPLAASVFTFLLVASYLLVRRHWMPSGLVERSPRT